MSNVELSWTFPIREDVRVAVHNPESGRRVTHEVGDRAVVLFSDGTWDYRPSRVIEAASNMIASMGSLTAILTDATCWAAKPPPDFSAFESW